MNPTCSSRGWELGWVAPPGAGAAGRGMLVIPAMGVWESNADDLPAYLPWWNHPEFYWVLGLTALAVAGALAWVALLRRQVQAQTELLLERLGQISELEERYRELFENAHDIIFTVGLDGRLTAVNKAAETVGGFVRSEILGHEVFELLKPQEREAARQTFSKLTAPGRPLVGVWEVAAKDGRLVPLEVSLRPLTLDSHPVGVQGIARDISERRRAEEALRESERRYRLLFERNLAGVFVSRVDPETMEARFLDGNEAFVRMLGLASRQELLATDPWKVYPEPALREPGLRDLRERRALIDVEFPLLRKDGSVAWLLGNLVVVDEDAGAAIILQGTVIDITERRRAEREIAERTASLAALVENSPLAIVVHDPQGRVQMCNPAFERLFGYPAGEVLGGNIDDLIVPAEARASGRDITRRVTRGEGVRSTTQRQRKDGSRVDVELHGVPLVVGGQVVGAYGLYDDITERVRAEKALESAKEAAEAASRAKSEFLAMMSHEIRTPMNGIIGMTELALDTPLTSEQRDYLGMVKESADALLTVINDILDFSKIEARRLDLDSVAFHLHDTLSHTLRVLAPRADEKHLELAWHAAEDIPPLLQGDPGRLRQILTNLVGNAIKFTERGEVVLRVETAERSGDSLTLSFSVRDTGIGIPLDRQAAIFEAFSQVDASSTRKYGGSGLGLAISRRLVEMMGGRIWVESRPGSGSTFHFTAVLRVVKAAPSAHEVAPVEELAGMPVLIVDDNSTNRRILESMVLHWKMRPALAGGGEEGLGSMQGAADRGEPFPLVIVDALMPGMDGFALVQEIKARPELAGATVMMLTSAGQRGDAARCHALGIAAYLIKPIRRSELLEAILLALGMSTRPAPEVLVTRHTLRESRRRLRVLLAEDNRVNQELIVRLLEKRGHEVVVAATGREVMERLEAAGFTGFDVALMDVRMPEMDGWQAAAAIREQEKTLGTHLPIVALTAHAMRGDRERCLQAGMDSYLSKPLQPSQLITVLEGLLTCPPGGQDSTSVETVSEDVLDTEATWANVEGDRELLAEMVRLFEETSPKIMAQIQSAFESKDAAGLRDAAHTLKGCVGNFAARRTLAAVGRLEDLVRTERWQEVSAALESLQEEMEHLLAGLSRLALKVPH